jgi:hypothetical protein
MVTSRLGLAHPAAGLLVGRQGLLAHEAAQLLTAGQSRQAVCLAGAAWLLWTPRTPRTLAAPGRSIGALRWCWGSGVGPIGFFAGSWTRVGTARLGTTRITRTLGRALR